MAYVAGMDDETMIEIATHGKSLKCIYLSEDNSITDVGSLHLMESCPSLYGGFEGVSADIQQHIEQVCATRRTLRNEFDHNRHAYEIEY